MLLIFQISSPNVCDCSEVDKKDTTVVCVVVENEAYGVFGVRRMVDNKSDKKFWSRGRGRNLYRDSKDKELVSWKRERDEGVECAEAINQSKYSLASSSSESSGTRLCLDSSSSAMWDCDGT